MCGRSTRLLAVALLLAGCGQVFASLYDDGRVKELLDLQRRSKSGVITLDSAAFDRYAAGKARPYSLFVFGDARQLRKKGRLNLEGRLEAFAAVARAFAATHAGKPSEGRAFFARLVYEDAGNSFGRMGVSGLPFLGRVPPTLHVRDGASIALDDVDRMAAAPHITWGPVELGAFVQERTGLSPGDLSAAGAASRSRFLPILTLIIAAGLSYAGWQLYQASFMRWTPLYALGALVVYWFAVSGGMYNIIRGVPLVGYDHRTKQAVLFMAGQGQMGAEGFIMGSMYVMFGLGVAGFTRVLPTIKDDGTRRAVGFGAIVVLTLLMNAVVGNHVWKTGMQPWFYF